jgi:hypothetical protein
MTPEAAAGTRRAVIGDRAHSAATSGTRPGRTRRDLLAEIISSACRARTEWGRPSRGRPVLPSSSRVRCTRRWRPRVAHPHLNRRIAGRCSGGDPDDQLVGPAGVVLGPGDELVPGQHALPGASRHDLGIYCGDKGRVSPAGWRCPGCLMVPAFWIWVEPTVRRLGEGGDRPVSRRR